MAAETEWDLRSEMTIDGTRTLWTVRKASGEEVAENTYTEQNGMFTFHRSGKYELCLRNPRLRNRIKGQNADTVEFIWQITVKVDSFMVSLVSAPVDGGVVVGNGKYEKGESVTITATPNTGYRFVNWTKGNEVFSTEAVYTFTVSEDLSLTANFEEIPVVVETFTVSVSENNSDWGTATITGSGEYEKGESVTITATPNTGYRFVNWTKGGEVFSTEAVHTFTVSEDLSLTANFEKDNVANEPVDDMEVGYVYSKNRTIYLSEDMGEVQVYNVSGVCVFSGCATAIPVKSSGLYIVVTARRNFKVPVR